MDLQELQPYVGKKVELHFLDGHVVRATLVRVDVDDPQEIIYDIHEIVAVGPRELAGVKPGTVAAADPAMLSAVELLKS